jgi:hypothetical protein
VRLQDFAELLVDGGHMGSKVPTMDEPFCMRCQALLGAPVPAQGAVPRPACSRLPQPAGSVAAGASRR